MSRQHTGIWEASARYWTGRKAFYRGADPTHVYNRLRMQPLALVCAALILLPCYGADTFRIYVIDVEGGGATLVVGPSGDSMLIDSGSAGDRDPNRIADAMRSAGLSKIDYLFTTHYDGDHVGGAPG